MNQGILEARPWRWRRRISSSVLLLPLTGSAAFTVTLIGSIPIAGAAPCTLCLNGDEPSDPSRSIDVPEGPFPDTCQELVIWAAAVGDEDVPECDLFRLLGVYCGCPTTENSCPFCPLGEDATGKLSIKGTLADRDKMLETENEHRFDFLAPLLGFSPNCAQLESITALNPTDSDAAP